MKLLVALIFAVTLVGCSNPPTDPEPLAQTPPAKSEAPAEVDPPMSPIYDQLHSAMFQADAAVGKLRQALDIAHQVETKLPPDIAEDIRDMIATLDDAGASLADRVGEELPKPEEVAKSEGKFKGKMTDLKILVDDILVDLREQEGVAASLVEMGPADTSKDFGKIDELLNQAIEDLLETKKTLEST